jgi:hypothetical protein
MHDLPNLIQNSTKVVKMVMTPRAWSLYVCSTSLCLLGLPQSSASVAELFTFIIQCRALFKHIPAVNRACAPFCSALEPKPEPVHVPWVAWGRQTRPCLGTRRTRATRQAEFKSKHGDDKCKQGKDKSRYKKAKNGNAMAKHEEAANPEPTKASARVLDVDAGSGYLTNVSSATATATTAEATAMMPNRDRARAQAQARQWSASSTSPLTHRNIRADGLGDGLDSQVVLVPGDGRLGAYFFLFNKGRIRSNPIPKCV